MWSINNLSSLVSWFYVSHVIDIVFPFPAFGQEAFQGSQLGLVAEDYHVSKIQVINKFMFTFHNV